MSPEIIPLTRWSGAVFAKCSKGGPWPTASGRVAGRHHTRAADDRDVGCYRGRQRLAADRRTQYRPDDGRDHRLASPGAAARALAVGHGGGRAACRWCSRRPRSPLPGCSRAACSSPMSWSSSQRCACCLTARSWPVSPSYCRWSTRSFSSTSTARWKPRRQRCVSGAADERDGRVGARRGLSRISVKRLGYVTALLPPPGRRIRGAGADRRRSCMTTPSRCWPWPCRYGSTTMPAACNRATSRARSSRLQASARWSARRWIAPGR